MHDTASGLTYMQARYYHPVTGRFLSNDPVGFADTGNPQMFNRYAYTWNDPVNAVDPDGGHPVVVFVVREIIRRQVKSNATRAVAAGSGSRGNSSINSGSNAIVNAVKAEAARQAIQGMREAFGNILANDESSENSEGSVEENSAPELKDMKKISKGRIRQLGKKGFDAEEAKKEVGMGGKEDLYADSDGNIYAGAKDGTGEATPIGENVDEILDRDEE